MEMIFKSRNFKVSAGWQIKKNGQLGACWEKFKVFMYDGLKIWKFSLQFKYIVIGKR